MSDLPQDIGIGVLLSSVELNNCANAWQNQQNVVHLVKTRVSLGICPV